jgi:hypothetical protein
MFPLKDGRLQYELKCVPTECRNVVRRKLHLKERESKLVLAEKEKGWEK